MPVTHDDVAHIAELARLDIAPDRLDSLAAELNGILGHMEVLAKVDTHEVDNPKVVATEGTPLRADTSGPIPLLAPIRSFATSLRDGFFIVPRLSTHEEAEDSAP